MAPTRGTLKRFSESSLQERRSNRTAPRARRCTWRHMHDPRIVIDWLAAREHVKNINQAWFTARTFARIFAKQRRCDVSEVMGSTRRALFETLRRARIRLDAFASLVSRQWWRVILGSSISIFLYVDSSPQLRGEDMFASSFEIWDQRLPWSREMMPVLSLERHMHDARSKTLALLFQTWLLVGPSVEEMIRFCSRVRCILTDMGTERSMAKMVDCPPLPSSPSSSNSWVHPHKGHRVARTPSEDTTRESPAQDPSLSTF